MDAMQIQENVEYDVKTLLQTVLDTMKTLRHADDVAYPKPEKLRRMRMRFNQRKTREIRKRGNYNVKI